MSTFPQTLDLTYLSAQLAQGNYKAVSKQVKPFLKKATTSAVVFNIAGVALCGQQKLREALPLFQKALARDSRFHDARKNYAQTLILLEQPDKALLQLNQLLKHMPENGEAQYLKAQAMWGLGAFSEANSWLSACISKTPSPHARLFNLRALVRGALGQEFEALSDYDTALAIDPNNLESLVNSSRPMARQTRHQESQDVISHALSLSPDHLGANLRQAALHLERGEKDLAKARYRKILQTHRHHAEALEQLAPLLTSDEVASHKVSLQAAQKLTRKPGQERAQLHFGLATLAKKTKDAARFADHLAKANAELAAQFPYDPNEDRHLTDAIIAQFSPASNDTPTPGPRPRPVFITGLPRSGTTLTETILGAHPAVSPLGERAVAGYLSGPFLDGSIPFDRVAQSNFAKDYLERLPALPRDILAFSDKMPENYRYIGYLATAFPDARFICMRRDPRDVALSMWQSHFSGQALSYSYDLANMAHRFNLHARLQAHWQEIFADRLRVQTYENLVADVDLQSREIAAFAGLGWVPEMAEPGKTSTPVLTLSAGQIRQAVHQRSVGAWKEHRDMLTPFIQKLDPGLWPEIEHG